MAMDGLFAHLVGHEHHHFEDCVDLDWPEPPDFNDADVERGIRESFPVIISIRNEVGWTFGVDVDIQALVSLQQVFIMFSIKLAIHEVDCSFHEWVVKGEGEPEESGGRWVFVFLDEKQFADLIADLSWYRSRDGRWGCRSVETRTSGWAQLFG